MKINLMGVETVADLQALIAGADPSEPVVFTRSTKTVNSTGTCWCGCGGTTKSRFVPGHDSKFHGLAKKVARGEAEMPESFVCDEAEADFMHWHDNTAPVVKKEKKAKVVEMVEMPETVESEVDVESAEFQALLAEVSASE